MRTTWLRKTLLRLRLSSFSRTWRLSCDLIEPERAQANATEFLG